MIEFYFKVSNARPDQQKPRLRLGFAKVGRTSLCPLQNHGFAAVLGVPRRKNRCTANPYTEKKSLKFVTSNRRFWLKFSHLLYKRISLSFSNGLVFVTS